MNGTALKKQNRKQILKLLRNRGATSRKDIAHALELTPAAVTIITNEMINEEILLEKGQQEEKYKRVGRKKILLDINYDKKVVLGASMENHRINIGVCNLKGEVIDSLILEDLKGALSYDLEGILNRIKVECISLLWRNNKKHEDVLGMGIGIVGPVERKKGLSMNSYGLFKEQVPLKLLLEKHLNIPVRIENNVRALAMAEMDRYSNKKIKNIFFVKYGPGIGSAVILNHELYYGSHDISGELGHTVVTYNGRPCKCGKKGCLETIASESSIIKRLQESYSSEKVPVLFNLTSGNINNINILNLLEAVEKGDKLIAEIINEAAFYMAMGIANAVVLYDPAKVVLYGRAFKNDTFIKCIHNFLRELTNNKDIHQLIDISQVDPDQSFAGGASLALRDFFYEPGGLY